MPKSALKDAEVAARIEDLEYMDEHGVNATEAAARTGFPSPSAMEKWLHRHDAYDLWTSMKRREPAGTHNNSKTPPRVVAAADGTAVLLAEAKQSTRKRTRSKAERIDTLLGELRQALTAEQAEDRAAAEARAEIERLERELSEARAKLRGVAAPVRTDRASDIRAWAAQHDLECSSTGRIPADIRKAYESAREADAA